MSETKQKKHAPTTRTTRATRTTAASVAPSKRSAPTTKAPPWIEGGIDYGPALVAIEELAAWAFDLAAASVADSREAARSVKNARRYILNTIRGKRPAVSAEVDVMFTAGLLARIFDADLGLGLGDIVGVLSELGLPITDVPFPQRRPSGTVRAGRPGPTAAELGAALGGAFQHPAPPVPLFPLGGRLVRPHTQRAALTVAPCASCAHGRPGFPVAA